MYVCPKCGRPHSTEEFRGSRFCRNCGKFLASSDRYRLDRQADSMVDGNENSIERAYRMVRLGSLRDTLIDSLDVVKKVEEHRQFWKPEKTNVILLAESHVYTDEKDNATRMNKPILHGVAPGCPLSFVRFVYCLGYGENELLNQTRTDRRNTGTYQYWKIFSSCVAENEDNLGFQNILKTKTRSFTRRIRNKVHVLRKMRNAGIWLLDASIVGLYGSGKKDPDTMKAIIRICWKNHLRSLVQESSPRHIVVIGIDVEKSLHSELKGAGFPVTVVRQPQGDRRSSEEQHEKYRICQRICKRYS